MNRLETINRVEVLGTVGAVSLTTVGGERLLARLSVLTSDIHRSAAGDLIEEHTWHSVTAWDGRNIPAGTLTSIRKGDIVHVKGRIRSNRYTTESGEERSTMEILASTLERTELSPDKEN